MTSVKRIPWAIGIGLSGVIVISAGAGGCLADRAYPLTTLGGGGDMEGVDAGAPLPCVDLDGDGHGDHCAEGADCDDADPEVTDECFACPTPKPGCPCAEEGEQTVCGIVDMNVGQQHTCGMGLLVCAGGRWGECVINSTVTLVPDAPSPGWHPMALGGMTPCSANPCDPYCQHFPDTPSGLTDADAGIVGADAGITLVDPIFGAPDPTNCTGGTLGTCSHSICSAGTKLTAGCDGALGCVATVCGAHPTCCSSKWDGACVAWAQLECNLGCGAQNGACVVCYRDSTDHDGDGYSFAQGDCADCDPSINPGAYDFPGNGVDEDCDGAADNEVATCDTGLALASSTALDYAKAIDLCRSTTATATGSSKTWGVIAPALVQANGTSAPHALTRGIMSQFGPNNLPQKGARMAAFSSGTARAPGSTGWVNPNGQVSSFNAATSCAFPTGFPKNATGCPNAVGSAYDSSGLKMNIRVPTNALSFTYRFNFFTSEYPEYTCSAYNDSYVALLTSSYLPANPAVHSKNISFDSNNNPVNVNIGLFNVTSGPQLLSTGFDGTCGGQICGGATGWLQTSAPVVPGETVTIHFAIWDGSDHVWDSIVLLDDWTWSESPATIQTGVPPPPPVAMYSPGVFVRDYDLTGVCPEGTAPQWGLWSWNSVTPSDSSISFAVQIAATPDAIDSAPKDALIFSNPPGPAAFAGHAAVARTSSGTSAGSVIVENALKANNRIFNLPVLRITTTLSPSTNKLAAPTLSAWDLAFDCATTE